MILLNEPPVKTINLLITDDHQMVRDGIRVMLESQENHFIFNITEAYCGEDAIKNVLQKDFDIILMDYNMPGMNGAETVKNILFYRPNSKILALSNFDELSYINNMLAAGANGYVLKNMDPGQLIHAIKTILDDKAFYSNEVAVKLIEAHREPVAAERKYSDEESYGITKREMEVLSMIAMEMTNDEISAALAIGKRTVDSHRQNLLNKLHAKNTVGLLKAAYSLKLITM
jgi:DNA-binding NarL/FixJ family response regulator